MIESIWWDDKGYVPRLIASSGNSFTRKDASNAFHFHPSTTIFSLSSSPITATTSNDNLEFIGAPKLITTTIAVG